MRPRDLLTEALAGLRSPGPRRADVLGTVIGVGALVATLGLSKTAGNQIVGRFDAFSATDVVVSPSARAGGTGGVVLPWDAESRLRRLNGVAAAGTLSDVDVRGALVRSVPINDPLGTGLGPAADEGGVARPLPGLRARSTNGRFFDAGHSARGDRVLVLGPNAAAAPRHRPHRPAAGGLPGRPAVRRRRPARRRQPPGIAASARRSCPRAPLGASSACRARARADRHTHRRRHRPALRTYPALRAAALEPVDALRAGT